MGLHIRCSPVTRRVTILLLLGLLFMVHRTKVGKAMRRPVVKTSRHPLVGFNRGLCRVFFPGIHVAAGAVLWA